MLFGHFQAAFILILGPFVFFDVQKTKYMQLFTTAMRWLGVYAELVELFLEFIFSIFHT